MLVDMAQQSFHAKSPINPISEESGHDVATVLHFCALREALINNFLVTHLNKKSIPSEIIDRLFKDNKSAKQKFDTLFSSVVKEKWGNAVKAASKHGGHDYKPVSELMKRAAEKRNAFLHGGDVWGIGREFSEECINSLPSLFGLFVALHNVYTHSLMAPRIQV